MAISLTPVGVGVRNQNAANPVEIVLTEAVPAGRVLVLAAFATSVVTLTNVVDDKSNSYTRMTISAAGQGNGYWVHALITTGLAAGEKIYATFSTAASRRLAVAVMVDGAAAGYIDAQGASAQTGTGAAPVVNTGPQVEAGETVLAWIFATSPLVTVTEDVLWNGLGEGVADNRVLHVAGKGMPTTAADAYAPSFSSGRDWTANWLAIKAASAPSGYTLTAAVATLALSGRAAVAKAMRRMPAAARSYTTAGISAAIRRGLRVRADARGYGLTGRAANLARGLRLALATSSHALTGIAAGLLRTIAGRRLAADPAALIVQRRPAGVSAARRVRATAEALVWSRLDAALRRVRLLVTSPGGFGLSGRPVAWGWVHILTPAPTDFAVTASDAVLRYSGVQFWQPAPRTTEAWAPERDTSEIWTPAGETPEAWS